MKYEEKKKFKICWMYKSSVECIVVFLGMGNATTGTEEQNMTSVDELEMEELRRDTEGGLPVNKGSKAIDSSNFYWEKYYLNTFENTFEF